MNHIEMINHQGAEIMRLRLEVERLSAEITKFKNERFGEWKEVDNFPPKRDYYNSLSVKLNCGLIEHDIGFALSNNCFRYITREGRGGKYTEHLIPLNKCLLWRESREL